MALNNRQKKFIEEYLRDFNGSAAARRSGYAGKRVDQTAYELLRKPEIQRAIAARAHQATATNDATPERVIAEFARVAFANIRDFASWHPDTGVTLIPSEDLTGDQTAAIAEVNCVSTITRTGDEELTERHSIKLKAWDKLKALESLGRYHALFTDRAKLEADEALTKILELLGAPRG